jgi:hypothetical protein
MTAACKFIRGFCAGLLIVGLPVPMLAQEPSSPVQSTEFFFPEGTKLPIALTTFLNSRSSQVGDSFYADTTYPIWIQQRLVIPRGSIVKGTVTHVQRPGKVKGKGQIAIRFDNILLPNGVSRDLVASLHGIHGPGNERIERTSETVEMEGSGGRDAGTVAGTAGQGALVGVLSAGGKGAGIGAGIGSAAGAAVVLLSRGRELILEPGTGFELLLKQSLRFAYGELDFTAQDMNGTRQGFTRRDRQNRNHDHQPNRWGIPFPWFSPWP